MDINWHDFSTDEPITLTWREIGASATYYDLLQVAPHAELEVIKGAYRALMRKHHPDSLPPEARAEGEEVVKLINQAYSVLMNAAARAEYNQSIGLES
jgi:DnaJ-class molecular chaperone